MANKNKTSVINIVMLAILLLFVIASNISPALSILLVLSIIPMVLISMGSNIVFSISSVVITSALSFILYGGEFALAATFVYMLPSLFTGFVFNNEEHIDKYGRKFKIKFKKDGELFNFVSIKAMLISMIIFVIGTLIYFVLLKYLMDIDIVKEVKHLIVQILTEYKRLISEADFNKLESVGLFTFLSDISTMILISTFAKSLLYSIIAYFGCINLFNSIYRKRIIRVNFDNIVLPGRPVMFLFTMLITMFLVEYSYPNQGVATMLNGFLIIMNMLFFIEGVSLIVFAIKAWSFVRKDISIIIVLFLIIVMGIVPGIAVLGMLDNSIDFRKKWYPGINK